MEVIFLVFSALNLFKFSCKKKESIKAIPNNPVNIYRPILLFALSLEETTRFTPAPIAAPNN